MKLLHKRNYWKTKKETNKNSSKNPNKLEKYGNLGNSLKICIKHRAKMKEIPVIRKIKICEKEK